MNLNKQFFAWINGEFEWDDETQGLIFIKLDGDENETKKTKKRTGFFIDDTTGLREMTFKEDIEILEKLRFRKFFLRKCRIVEEEVITLQDVKDVVLFTADVKSLTGQYIDFLHIVTIDSFLRALIIYFQFYFMTYDKLSAQRKLLSNKIKHPNMAILENSLRDDLSDLRSMVSREYCSLLIGAKESLRFHHMSQGNGVSLSDRDRRLLEILIKFSSRVVWYALHKPTLSIIQRETDRLIRSDHFNKYSHQHGITNKLLDCEKEILTGLSNFRQPRLTAQSPLGKEVIFADHDYRMLAVGQANFPPDDKRKTFLELAYMLPEEHFANQEICIGILGMRRTDFDLMLKKKRKKSTSEDESAKKDDEIQFHFNIPERIDHSTEDAIRSSFSQSSNVKLAIFSRATNREIQRGRWRHWVTCPNRDTKYEDITTRSITHVSTTALYL